MRTKYHLETQSRLQTVSAVFAHWRGTHKPRSRIPEELWQTAVDLAPCYFIHWIARALMTQLHRTEAPHQKASRRRASGGVTRDRYAAAQPAATCVLNLRSPMGFELKTHNFGRIQSQLAPLISCFLGQRR